MSHSILLISIPPLTFVKCSELLIWDLRIPLKSAEYAQRVNRDTPVSWQPTLMKYQDFGRWLEHQSLLDLGMPYQYTPLIQMISLVHSQIRLSILRTKQEWYTHTPCRSFQYVCRSVDRPRIKEPSKKHLWPSRLRQSAFRRVSLINYPVYSEAMFSIKFSIPI